jgi:hypothetical protein
MMPKLFSSGKVFLLPTTAPVKGGGHGMKWADLLCECGAWWNEMVLASEMKEEWYGNRRETEKQLSNVRWKRGNWRGGSRSKRGSRRRG